MDDSYDRNADCHTRTYVFRTIPMLRERLPRQQCTRLTNRLYSSSSRTTHSLPPVSMSAGTTFESPDLKKSPLVEVPVEEDVPPPTYEVADIETAIPPPMPSPESRPVSRIKAFSFTALYTIIFAIATLIFCLYGSLVIGFSYDERLAAFTRLTYAALLGSFVLGPIYFTNSGFITCIKTRNEVANIHLANGRLLKALGHSLLLCAAVLGVVASAATVGCGLIFWPFVYSGSLSTKKMVVAVVLIPVASLLGGLRWTLEFVTMTMWIVIRIPKISTGLEGAKHDRLIVIAFVLFPRCFLLLS